MPDQTTKQIDLAAKLSGLIGPELAAKFGKLTSRKLWVTLLGLYALLAPESGIDPDADAAVIVEAVRSVAAAAVAVVYLFAQGRVDAADQSRPGDKPS